MVRTMVVVVAVVLGACGFEHGAVGTEDARRSGSGGDADTSAPWLADYTHRKPIELSPPNTGPLTNFPVGILLPSDAQLAALARTDGRDIVFTAGDGTTRLDHELVSFNIETGAIEAWVRIPTLPAGPTTIFVYYGSSPSNDVGTAAWSSAFSGVWHLGTALGDSTSHNHAALGSAASLPALGDGISGGARDFDGQNDVLSIGDPADNSLDFGTSSFSFSLWVRVTSSSTTFDPALYKGGATTNDAGYCVLLGTANWNMKVHDGVTYHDPIAGTETLGAWIYLAGVVDRAAGQVSAYRNGVLANMQPLAGFGSVSNAQPLTLGKIDTTYYHGRIDELRISNTALSLDWVATEYANLTSSTFAVPGSEQAR